MSLTKNSLIKIAKILKPHGIKGEVKILPFTDDIDRFLTYREFYLSIDKGFEKVILSHFKRLRQFVIFAFDRYNSLSEIEKFRNRHLHINRNTLKESSSIDTEPLVDDLIGCSFSLFSDQSKVIGSISDYCRGGTNGIYEIVSLVDAKKGYIPCNREFFCQIDLDNRRVIFDDSKVPFFFQ